MAGLNKFVFDGAAGTAVLTIGGASNPYFTRGRDLTADDGYG